MLKNNINTLLWIKKVNKGNNKFVIILAVISAVISFLSIYGIVVMKNAIDSATTGKQDGFILYGLLYAFMVIAQILLGIAVQYFSTKTKAKLENNLKTKLYKNLLKTKLKHIDNFHSAKLMSRFTNDVQIISDNFVNIIPNVLGSGLRLIFAFMLFLWIEPWIALAAFVAGIFFFFGSKIFGEKIKSTNKEVQESYDNVETVLKETVENISLIRSFVIENKMISQIKKATNWHYIARIKKINFSNMCNLAYLLAFRVTYLLAFFWCGSNIVAGTMSFGTLTAMLQLVNQIQQPVANISNYIPKYFSMVVSVERVLEIISMEKEKNLKAEEIPSFKSIVSQNLSFTYDNEKILKFKDITINQGDFVAIVGSSGIGKSTFLKLLMNFYDPMENSQLFIERQNDERIEISTATRKLFSYVPQSNLVFSGTIAEIICGNAKYSEEEFKKIKLSAMIACADEFIQNLSNKYDTLLGEKGNGLSVGQLQRISIARAIFQNRQVLLLDEATSALDENTEKRIIQNLKLITNNTVVLITHRKTSIDMCEKIIKVEHND